MISVLKDPIPQERQERMKAWLIAPESEYIREYVQGQIAELIADGAERALDQSLHVLVHGDVPPIAKERYAAAAVLKLFLNTLQELRNQPHFSSVTLHITK